MLQNIFQGKTILVTGGTGSIGLEIVRQVLAHKPKAVRIFSRDENKQYHIMNDPAFNDPALRFMVGDIRDKDRLRMAMEGADIVFHAAALKQIPLCEYNPFEAVKTNVIGTQNIIELARDLQVKKVIAISTDKVVNPSSVLGASKLVAEKLMLATYFYKGDKNTTFSCVRFGNVLGSRGSILPLIKKQIMSNGVVTVTDPKMTRFVMTISQAVGLVLDACALTRGHEVFVLKMPAVKLGDLIKAAIAHYAPLSGKNPSEIKMKRIGKRDGEKNDEQLLDDHELDHVLETDRMYVLTPFEKVGRGAYAEHYLGAKKIRGKKISSVNAPRLHPTMLKAMIAEADRQMPLL